MKNEEIKVGYGRCSLTDDKQDVERQIRELKNAGCGKIYFEYEHGDARVKAEQERMFAETPEGGTISVTEITRLSRSLRQICDLIERVKKQKLRLEILNSITIDCRSGEIDPMSEAFVQMAGVFGQLELTTTRHRVKSGLKNAVAKGVKLGRPEMTEDKLPKSFFKNYPKWKRGELSKTDFAKICEVGRATLDRYIKLVEAGGE